MKTSGSTVFKKYKKLFEVLISLLLALIIGGIFFLISGYNPLQVYELIIKGAFGNLNSFLTTLTYATPLILSGLSFTVAKQANIMNLGGEGQIYVGAMAAAIAGTWFPQVPKVLYVPFVLLVAFSAAGLYGGLAGYFNVKFGSNIVIVTIMMNYISQYFCGYLVAYPLRYGEASLQTKMIGDNAVIGRIFSGHQLSGVLILAILASVTMGLVIKYTKFGFHMRVVGFNSAAAETAGIPYKRITILTMIISAGIAGLCGAGQTMGVHFRFIDNFSSGYGFEGIAVAALAANSPVGVLLAGLLFAGLKSGAASVNRVANIPMDYISIIQALVIVFVAAPYMIDWIMGRIGSMRGKTKARRMEA